MVLLAVAVVRAAPIDLAAPPSRLDGTCLRFAGWDFCLRLDPARAQGLELEDVRFQGVPVLFSASLPFVQTAYPHDGGGYDVMKDSLGFDPSGHGNPGGPQRLAAHDCPRKLPHGLLWTPAGGPLQDRVCVEWDAEHAPREVAAWTRWDLGNYKFVQGYAMRADGTLLPFVELGGQLIDYWDGTTPRPPGDVCTARPGGGGAGGCRSHFHAAYWRLDFDVGGALGNEAQAFRWTKAQTTNQNGAAPPCGASTASAWCAWPNETRADRSLQDFAKWRVVHPASRNDFGNPRSVELQPLGEGGPTETSTHDVRAVRYKCHAARPDCEMGYEVLDGPGTDDSALDAYVDGEALSPGDVVLWYAQRVYHEVRDEDVPHTVPHALGPLVSTRNLVAGNPAG